MKTRGLLLRIGFWDPLYDNYNNKAPNSIVQVIYEGPQRAQSKRESRTLNQGGRGAGGLKIPIIRTPTP